MAPAFFETYSAVTLGGPKWPVWKEINIFFSDVIKKKSTSVSKVSNVRVK